MPYRCCRYGSGVSVRPVDELPPITDADIVTKIVGRATTITLGRGNVETAAGRRDIPMSSLLREMLLQWRERCPRTPTHKRASRFVWLRV